MKQAIVFTCVLFLFYTCSQSDTGIRKVIGLSRLPTQSFTINTTKDTTIITASGIKIKIASHSLVSSSQTVTLQIQEAKNIEDMVQAGLTTHSDDGILSSDGMFYIGFAEPVTIQKAIKVSYPTRFVNEKMQLYKGETGTDGNIDWKDPKPVDSFQSPVSDAGKFLFTNNCASCHAVDKRLTGPALAWADKRRSREWLHAMIRNPEALIKSDRTAACLYCNYHVLMTPFPVLSERTIDTILQYVDKVSQQKNIPQNFNPEKQCDSCGWYAQRYNRLLAVKDSLMRRRQKMVVKGNNAAGSFSGSNPLPASLPPLSPSLPFPASVVAPPSFGAEYYQFDITAAGWYNIDMLLHNCEGIKQSRLMVNIQGSYRERIQLYLVIPQVKVFIEGGLLEDKKMYGFDGMDGGIPLPQGARAIVFGVSEKGRKLYYGETRFTTSLSQTITVEVKETGQSSILSSLAAMQIQDAAIKEVSNQEDAVKLEAIDKEIQKITPQALECGCDTDTGSVKAEQ